MKALWHSIYYIDPPEGQRYPSLHQISSAIIQAFEVTNVLSVAERPDFDPRRSLTDDCNDHEHFSLSPYIYHARHNDFSFPDECPVTGFANTLCKLTTLCTTDELPSKAAWRAVLFYNVYSPTEFPVLSWTDSEPRSGRCTIHLGQELLETISGRHYISSYGSWTSIAPNSFLERGLRSTDLGS
jgi:hypothetical protein